MDQQADTGPQIVPWDLLDEEDVSPSKHFPVFRQTVKIHTGEVIDDYYITKKQDATAIVAITKEKEIILVQQWRQGISETTLELPCGENDGREPIDVARAELAEETGFTTKEFLPLGSITIMPSKSTQRIHGYLCYVDSIPSVKNLDALENINTIKVKLTDIDSYIISKSINDADMIAFITLARLKHPEAFL